MKVSRYSPPNVSIPSSEVPEIVLAHNLGSPIKYFVKFVGLPYNKAKWLTETELCETEQGTRIMKYYTNTVSLHKTKEPFYNPKFDEIDRIINKEGPNYIVKWMGLSYEHLTAEKDVPEKDLEIFRKRKSANYAEMNSKPNHSDDVELPKHEDFIREGFSIDEISFITAICKSYCTGSPYKTEENIWFKCSKSYAWFLSHLHNNYQCIGPHLIIVDEKKVEEWYNRFREIEEMTTICYIGSPLDRELIAAFEFSKKKKNLSFHVLITTPLVFHNEQNLFSSINWDTIATSDKGQTILNNEESSINYNFLLTISDNKEESIAMRNSLKVCLSKMKQMNVISKEMFPFTDSGDASDEGPKEAPTVTCYLVRRPMSKIQKQSARILLRGYKDSISNNKFCNVAYAMEKNLNHPFLLKNIEYQLGFPNLETSSSTTMILMKLIRECVDSGNKILISSNIKSDYQILLSVIGAMNIPFKYDEGQKKEESHEKPIYLHATAVIPELPPIDDYDYIVIIDSSDYFLGKWIEAMSTYEPKKSKKLFLFTCYHTTFQKPENMRLSEYICRTCAFESFYKPDEDVDVDEVLRNVEQFDIREPIKKDPPSFIDHELMSENFWDAILDTPNNDINIIEPKKISEDYEFTTHERNGLTRAIAIFPWGAWHLCRENCGVNFSDEEIAILCKAIINRIKEEDPSMTFPLFVERSCTYTDFVLDKGAFAVPDFYKAIKRLSHNFQASIESANCIHSYLKGKTFETLEIPNISLPDPLPFGWSRDLDKALLFGVDKYGVNMYDVFPSDENPLIRKVFKIGRKIPNFDGILIKRAFSFAAAIRKIIIDTPPEKETTKDEGFESWTCTERNNLNEALINFGIPFNENGERDMSKLAEIANIPKKSIKDINAYLTHVLTNKKKPNLAISVSNSISVMNNLHKILNTNIRDQIFQRLPRWEDFPEEWTAEVELQFFEKIEQEGFGAQVDIIKENFSHCFKDIDDIPSTATQKSALFRRINKIEWLHERVQNALREKRHSPDFPMQLTETSTIYSIGTIVYDRSSFHTERYIYPVGYKTSRMVASLDDPSRKVKWFSEIRDGGNGPQFVVYPEDHPETVFTGGTPTAPWTNAMNALAKVERRRVSSISGPEAFLLSSPVVTNLIQKLPNAKLCHHYKFKYISSHSSKFDDDYEPPKSRR